MKRTLFDITEDLAAIDDLLAEVGGDVSDPAVESAIEGWFAEIESNFDAKADNYAALIRQMEARAEIRREESKRLLERARIDESSARFLKSRLITAMHHLGKRTVETDRFRISVAKNGGLQGVEVTGDVPPEFRKIVSEPDTAAIRTALLEGSELSFAHLRERGERLAIR